MEDNTAQENLPEEEALHAQAMLASLSQYELDEEDRVLLDSPLEEGGLGFEEEDLPVLAVIGRPNVGKSTLVNRVLGRREAIVQDLPGVTRDRVVHRAEWAGKDFYVVDTGGWEVGTAGLAKEVAAQAELAVEQADAVLFVVDANVGPTASDERVVELLRRAGKPVVLAANKVDSTAQESEAAALWALGLGEPLPISALHGRGTGDLLDAVVKKLPPTTEQERLLSTEGMHRVALIGKPNVGKSSLLNALLGEQRAVVHHEAGTTRDPVDEVVDLDGQLWNFIDTAGVKRRTHRIRGADYYALLRTQAALERAEVGLVLIDASVPLSEQDVRVVQQVVEAGRALVIANNKWDLVDEDRRFELERERDRELDFVSWAPQINLSARTTWHVNRIPRALDRALAGWQQRVPTGRLNAFFGKLIAAHPHPVRGGRQPRILFATQAGTRPPRFVLFTTGFLDATYRRFIERKLREEFGFEGTPIQLSMRVRERRQAR